MDKQTIWNITDDQIIKKMQNLTVSITIQKHYERNDKYNIQLQDNNIIPFGLNSLDLFVVIIVCTSMVLTIT